MALVCTMQAVLNRDALLCLADPNAIDGVNARYLSRELNHRALIVAKGLQLLDAIDGAVAVEIDCGEVVAVIVRKETS
jgi:hypothetical protein